MKGAPRVKIIINSTEVSSSEVYEYLGLSVDRSLSLSERINKVYRKAINRVHLLQRVRQKLTKQTAESIYKSVIRPLIAYFEVVLLCLSNSKIKETGEAPRSSGKLCIWEIFFGSLAIVAIGKTKKSSSFCI